MFLTKKLKSNQFFKKYSICTHVHFKQIKCKNDPVICHMIKVMELLNTGLRFYVSIVMYI